jgi:hypothetical protein
MYCLYWKMKLSFSTVGNESTREQAERQWIINMSWLDTTHFACQVKRIKCILMQMVASAGTDK